MSEDGCKVCRLRREYDLERLDETLLERWQRPKDRQGYRQLATYVNATLLEYELERAGVYTLEPAAIALYERLVDGDAEIMRKLRLEEVPLDRLERDFVSYGVIRTHLTECLGAEWSGTERTTEWERETLETVVPRLVDRSTDAIRSLVERGEIDVPETVEVAVETTVRCPTCDETAAVEALLEGGPLCDCSSSERESAATATDEPTG